MPVIHIHIQRYPGQLERCSNLLEQDKVTQTPTQLQYDNLQISELYPDPDLCQCFFTKKMDQDDTYKTGQHCRS